MKLLRASMAGCALALIGTTAMADCAADLAELKAGASGGGQGISKDGSLAPLEAPDSAAGDSTAASTTDPNTGGISAVTGGTTASSETAGAGGGGEEGVAKDGSLAPLEGSEGGGDTPAAMSGQDAEAQQRGDQTAAESAEGGASSSGDAASGAGGATFADGSVQHSALIVAAQAALDAGSEEACSAVLQLIRGP